MRALSINLCGAAELRSCGAAELRRYPYDGTAGTHRKRLVNFRNILAISLCGTVHPLWTPPIYDILFLNFSQGAILRSFTYSNSFGFDRRRLGRLSGRPRTDLTDDLLPVRMV